MTIESPSTQESSEGEEIELNDFVIWESQGVEQFSEPKRIIRIEDHLGEKFAFLEGSMTAIPVNELRIVFKTK